MKLPFKRLTETAHQPTRAHRDDAGLDLYLDSISRDGVNIICGSGVAVEIPQGCAGLLFARSSIYKTGWTLTNGVGVIDAGYRGEVKAVFRSAINARGYKLGERFAQLVVVPIELVAPIEAETLSDSERGEGGYGSTGR